MKRAAPEKIFLEAPTVGQGESCAHCPWMAMNDLRNLAQVLESGENEIHIDEAIRIKVLKATHRMLEFSKDTKTT